MVTREVTTGSGKSSTHRFRSLLRLRCQFWWSRSGLATFVFGCGTFVCQSVWGRNARLPVVVDELCGTKKWPWTL